MPNDPNKQVSDLLLALSAHCATHKGEFLKKIVSATRPLMFWLDYLRNTISRQTADRLLDATQAAIIEVAGCLSLGLVRPAIPSIRVQLELVLGWIYFNDHPVEWIRFEKTTRDYEFPGAVIKYLSANSDRYHDRFKLLASKKTRKTGDPYGVLSIHVHSTSPYSAPNIGPLSALVRPAASCNECVGLQVEVTEYLSDVLASWYADRWHDLPTPITTGIKARLGSAKLKEFCR